MNRFHDSFHNVYTSEEGISDTEKVKSKTVQFKSSDLNALASGSYTAVVEAYNLSGNHLVTSTQFIVDNTEPKVTGVSIRTSGKADTVTDNGIFTSKPITLTIQCSDGDYSAGIAQYELFNGTESLGSNTSGIFSIAAEDLADYEPTFAWESGPATQKQIEYLQKHGIFADEIPNCGYASMLIDKLRRRQEEGLATPKQIRFLERMGFIHVGLWSFEDASRIISWLNAHGWRLPYNFDPKTYVPKGGHQ